MAEVGTMELLANRLGTVGEITEMLNDFESAYCALFQFDTERYYARNVYRRLMGIQRDYFYDTRLSCANTITPDMMLPEYRLRVTKVRIESPGAWEVLGSLNPLQQIREYLNDRHERIKDKEYREAAEETKLATENEILRMTLYEKQNAVARERLAILREAGYSADESRQLIWEEIGIPIVKLRKHQDKGLLERAR